MPIVSFEGMVYPDFPGINCGVSLNRDMNCGPAPFDPEPRADNPIVVKIEQSRILVQCYLEIVDRQSVAEAWFHSKQGVTSAISSFAFCLGSGLIVRLDQFRLPDGILRSYPMIYQNLEGLCTAFDPSPNPAPESDVRVMASMVLVNIGLQLALNDLNQALMEFRLAPINCARAMEGIRTLISPNAPTRIAAWEAMRSTLQVDRSYLDVVIDVSIAPRHGQHVDLTREELMRLLEYSWKIMNRYLEFEKRGRAQLPLAEFSTLV